MLRTNIRLDLVVFAFALSACVPPISPPADEMKGSTLQFNAAVTEVSVERKSPSVWLVRGRLTNTGTKDFCFGPDDGGGIGVETTDKRSGREAMILKRTKYDDDPTVDPLSPPQWYDPTEATPPIRISPGESVEFFQDRAAVADYVFLDPTEGQVEPGGPYLGSYVRLTANIFPCSYDLANDALRDRAVVRIESAQVFDRWYPLELASEP